MSEVLYDGVYDALDNKNTVSDAVICGMLPDPETPPRVIEDTNDL